MLPQNYFNLAKPFKGQVDCSGKLQHSITKVDSTPNTLTGRGGLALFIKYLNNTGLL